MTRRVFLILLPMALLCSLVFSCARDAQPAPSPPVSPAEMQKPVYVLIAKEETNPYMRKMFEGFQIACGELGATAQYMGPGEYTARAQIAIVDRLVAEGHVDALAIAANDTDALEEPLKAAMASGIKVISLDSSVNPNSRMLHVQQADPEKIGRVLIQAASKMIGGIGKAGIISSTPQATNQNLWISWMKRELAENPNKYQNFSLLPVVYGQDDPTQSAQAATALLEENPDLSIIITPSVVGMLAVGRTLRERRSDVRFTGLGLPSEMAPYIEDESCPWMYLWNPIDIGYLAACSAHALHREEITGREGDILTAGTLGQKAVVRSADGGTEILLGDPVKFDRDNIKEWKSVY